MLPEIAKATNMSMYIFMYVIIHCNSPLPSQVLHAILYTLFFSLLLYIYEIQPTNLR